MDHIGNTSSEWGDLGPELKHCIFSLICNAKLWDLDICFLLECQRDKGCQGSVDFSRKEPRM